MMYDLLDQMFASNMYLELHYDDKCLTTKKDSSCFTVEVYNNGKPMKIDSCIAANKKRGLTSPICQYEDFMQKMNSLRFDGDLKKLCYQGYDPYP
jgi:hypothetical protein